MILCKTILKTISREGLHENEAFLILKGNTNAAWYED